MLKKLYIILFIILVSVISACLYLFFNNDTNIADNIDTGQVIESNIKAQNKIIEEPAMDIKVPQDVKFNNQNKFGSAKYLICIHKLSYKLDLYEKGSENPIRSFPIAVAKNTGDKQRPGDNKTPTSWGNIVAIPAEYKGADVGVKSSDVPFRVEEICEASYWTHDFNDGKGIIEGAYGPWFISLDTGWEGIGIHGTHDPNSIGTNASEGCIRLLNKDIIELKEIISTDNGGIGTKVIITED